MSNITMTRKKTYKPIIVDRDTYKVMKKIFGPSAGKYDVKIIDKKEVKKSILLDRGRGKEDKKD